MEKSFRELKQFLKQHPDLQSSADKIEENTTISNLEAITK